jgi:chromosome partitioning protein
LKFWSVNALAAAERAVLVTEPSGASVDGLGLALHLVEEVRHHMHPALQTRGVIINAADDRERESRHFVGEVRAAFGERCLEGGVPPSGGRKTVTLGSPDVTPPAAAGARAW